MVSWRGVLAMLVFSCMFISNVYGGKDLYDVLGIKRDASAPDIKRAFRKLSLKLHPDKNPGDEDAAQKFAEVASGMSFPRRHLKYDMYGEDGLKDNGGGGGHDPFDVFSQFFGGGRQRHPQEPSRGNDVTIPLRVSLADLYNGKNVPFTLETRRVGPGFIQQFQTQCTKCGGKGKVVTSTCPVCGGSKTVFADVELDLEIEKGMPDGHEIEFEHAADEHADRAAGHLRFRLTTAPHDMFSRDGDDLYMDMSISLREVGGRSSRRHGPHTIAPQALVGFSKTFVHLDGRTVEVSRRNDITEPSQVMTLAREGMPRHQMASERGNLHIKFNVIFPDALTPDQQRGFRELFQ
ncbi:hypothetical protein DYB32_003611 [Aphanomyces invadans]|uniref:J domain-containing protein n=1 Tax=Aphanomyces invadans TaxID=157072 RepID=A0A418B049_9STRA|nr:hypothetical protein DYB32_003611 [Aphanomyces invadans]